MPIGVWYFILRTRTVHDLVLSSFFQVSFYFCQMFFISGRKPARKILAHFDLRRSRRGENLNQQVQRWTRSFAPDLGDRGSQVRIVLSQEEYWRNSRTLVPPMKLKHRCRCRRCRPWDFLFLASRSMVSKNVWGRRSLNSNNIIPMPSTKSSQ